jgi:Glycosyltransferase family 87
MPSDRDAPIGAAVYFVAIAGIAYLIVILVQLPGGARRGDFSIYYACAVAMHRGLDPYAINLTELTRQLGFEADPFAHPADTPTFTLLTEPLALMTPEHAYAIWLLANVLCLVGSLHLLLRSSSQLNRTTAVLFSIGALGFTPLADNFRWAQSQVFALFGVLLFFCLMQRGRDGAAGALLAVLGLLRGFPLVLGGYLIVRRQWRAIGFLAMAFVVGAAATTVVIGTAPVENFLRVIGILGGHQWFSLAPRWGMAAANVSLDAFVSRPLALLFGSDLPTRLQTLRRVIVLSFQVVVLGITFWATADTKNDPQGRSLSLWVATMLILTPVVWLHYMVLLMIPFGMIAIAAARREVGARISRLAMLSYCFIVLATPLMSTLTFHQDIFDWRAGVVAETGFLALMSVWFASYRFATEPSSEASHMEGRSQAPAGS